MSIQIKNGATKSRYPHQRSQTGFAGDACASSPVVRAQFLKIGLGCKIDNDGMRRSPKSASAVIAANKIQPARRSRLKSARRFTRKVTVITMRKRTSGSEGDTQIANA